MLLTPEMSMALQNQIGSDIMMALDDVVDAKTVDAERFREACFRTLRWIDRCIAAHKRKEEQNLFGIVQGGLDVSPGGLRDICLEGMLKRDADLPGYAIGGLAGGEDKNDFWRVVAHCCDALPAHKPRYLMGVGYPLDLVVCSALGVDMYDCVYPTRTGRFGTALVPWGLLKLKASACAVDPRPIDPTCPCATCRNYSRATLHGLLKSDVAAAQLVTQHNIAYMLRLTRGMRKAVQEGAYPDFVRAFMRGMFPTGHTDVPKWDPLAKRFLDQVPRGGKKGDPAVALPPCPLMAAAKPALATKAAKRKAVKRHTGTGMAARTNAEMLDAALAELDDEEEQQAKSAAEAAQAAADAVAAADAAGFQGDEDTAAKQLMDKLADPDFKAALDQAMGDMKASGVPDGQRGATVDGAAPLDSDELDATLQATLDMMGKLGGDPHAADAAGGMSEEAMAEMMKEFESMGKKPDFQAVIDNIMKQLLTKDIMFEPVQEITARFPEWLADNRGKLSAEEYANYGRMYQAFQRLAATYETEPDNFPRIMELMQDLQACGQPPADIIKDLAPGLDFGPDGMPMLPNMGAGVPGMPQLPTGACCVQ
ncbi:qtrt1 [Symbiodinium sp. KB8]|nr:qtrt1 [Symbiodinium sp. KB8]